MGSTPERVFQRFLAAVKPQVEHQEVHWVRPPHVREFHVQRKSAPDQLWVLHHELDEHNKPTVPFRVISNVNAIWEQPQDDWQYHRNGTVEISGRTELGGNGYWVLVEWFAVK